MKRGRGGRDMEGKRGQERERERERRGAAQWPVVSVGLHGRVGVAARAVVGVCSAHLLKHRHRHRQWYRRRHMEYTCTHAHRAHRHRHTCTKHMRMQVQRCNGETGGSSLHR